MDQEPWAVQSHEHGILKSGPGTSDGSSQRVISNVAQKKESRFWSYKDVGQVLTLLRQVISSL